jgi:hypothetical protein
MARRWIALVLPVVVSLAACSGGGGRDNLAGTSTGAHANDSVVPAAFLSAAPDGNTLVEWSSNGQQLRTVRFNMLGNNVSLSPDGKRLLVVADDDNRVLDSRGKDLVHGVKSDNLVWADDSRHLCGVRTQVHPLPNNPGGMAPDPATFRFVVIDPGRGTRFVPGKFEGTVGGSLEGNYGPEFLRCSVSEGTALVEALPGALRGPVEINLKTGRVTTPRWEHKYFLNFIAISGDGRYALESIADRWPTAEVVDTATGARVATIHGGAMGMSWSGHVVLVFLPKSNGQLALINWQTRITVWRGPRYNGVPNQIDSRTAAVRHNDDLGLFLSPLPGDSKHRLMSLSFIANTKKTRLAAEARWVGTDRTRFGASW